MNRLKKCGTGLTNHISITGNHAARKSLMPPNRRTTPAVYATATSEYGGRTIDHEGDSTISMTAWSRTCTTAMVTARIASPHHVPSISQRSERHTRRIKSRLTSGTTPPIDFSGSFIHIVHRTAHVELIANRPSALSA